MILIFVIILCTREVLRYFYKNLSQSEHLHTFQHTAHIPTYMVFYNTISLQNWHLGSKSWREFFTRGGSIIKHGRRTTGQQCCEIQEIFSELWKYYAKKLTLFLCVSLFKKYCKYGSTRPARICYYLLYVYSL